MKFREEGEKNRWREEEEKIKERKCITQVKSEKYEKNLSPINPIYRLK